MEDIKVTTKEKEAIEALKAAIKALPRGVYFDIDAFDGQVMFWKRLGPGLAQEAAKPLRCKRATSL